MNRSDVLTWLVVIAVIVVMFLAAYGPMIAYGLEKSRMRKRAQIKPPRVTWRMRRAMPYTYTVTYSGAAGKWLVKGDITIPATHVRTSAVLTSTTFRGPNRKEAVRQFKEWVKAEREGAYTQYKSKIKPEREWVW